MNKFVVAIAFGTILETSALTALNAPQASAQGGGHEPSNQNGIDAKRALSSKQGTALGAHEKRPIDSGFGMCGGVGESYICSP